MSSVRYWENSVICVFFYTEKSSVVLLSTYHWQFFSKFVKKWKNFKWNLREIVRNVFREKNCRIWNPWLCGFSSDLLQPIYRPSTATLIFSTSYLLVLFGGTKILLFLRIYINTNFLKINVLFLSVYLFQFKYLKSVYTPRFKKNI